MLLCVGVNNNAAVDTFAKSLQARFDRLGLGPKASDIVRLYGIESEVSGMFHGIHEPASIFNRDRATAVGTDGEGKLSDLD